MLLILSRLIFGTIMGLKPATLWKKSCAVRFRLTTYGTQTCYPLEKELCSKIQVDNCRLIL